MTKRDPFTYPGMSSRHTTMPAMFRRDNTKPKIGVTQGGSSRKFSGAKPAATDGQARPQKLGDDYDKFEL